MTYLALALCLHVSGPKPAAPNIRKFTSALPFKEAMFYRRIGRLLEMSTPWYIPCDAFDGLSVAVPTFNLWCPNE